MKRSEKDFQVVGILMMVVVDPLPGRGQEGQLEHPVAVQNPAVQAVPDQWVSDDDGADGKDGLAEARWVEGPNHGRGEGQGEVADDRRILEVSDPQLAKGHADWKS